MSVYQQRVFQAAVEIAIRAAMPQGVTLANIVDRVASSSKGLGCPSEYKNEDWARDFLTCLPEDADAMQLVILCYLPAYSCRCNVIHLEQGRCDVCGEWPEPYRGTSAENRRAGGLSKAFWHRIQQRRLFGRGLRIVEGGR